MKYLNVIIINVLISIFLLGCHSIPEKPVSRLYDSSLSSQTIDRELISEIKWAHNWADYFLSQGEPPQVKSEDDKSKDDKSKEDKSKDDKSKDDKSKDDKSKDDKSPKKNSQSDVVTIKFPIDDDSRGKIASLLREDVLAKLQEPEGSSDNLKEDVLAKLEDIESSSDKRLGEIKQTLNKIIDELEEKNRNLFQRKHEQYQIAGILKAYAQQRLVNWAEEKYKDTILKMLHPRSKGIINDIEFEVKPLSAGQQKTQTMIESLVKITGGPSFSQSFNESTMIIYDDGEPLLFEILYVLNNQAIEDLFYATEDSFFDDIPACILLSPHKRLWLSGVPLRFVYFPKVSWIDNSKRELNLEAKIKVAELGELKTIFEEKEDKTLSYSFSPPIKALPDNAFSFCYTGKKRIKESQDKYFFLGWSELLVVDDYYAAYKINWNGEKVTLSNGFVFYKIRINNEKKELEGTSKKRINDEKLDIIDTLIVEKEPLDKTIYAVIPKSEYFPNDLASPLGFLKFYFKDNILQVEQLTSHPYSLPDRQGKKELQLNDHPATNIRIKLQTIDSSK